MVCLHILVIHQDPSMLASGGCICADVYHVLQIYYANGVYNTLYQILKVNTYNVTWVSLLLKKG